MSPPLVGSPSAVYTLSTRTVESGGGPVRSEVDDPGNRLRNSGCRHVLIMVHGFNNSASQAKQSYLLQLEMLESGIRQSRSAPDAIAFFHWPGDVGGWFSVTGYPWDIPQAQRSAERLATYLTNFPAASNPGAVKVSIVAHSLGCRLILEMLARNLPAGLALNIELINLLAPAVPVRLVEEGTLQVSVRSPRQVLKCFSNQDGVLRNAFPAGQLAAHELGTEPQYYSEAVGLNGHPTTMGTPVERSIGHSDYWGDRIAANQFLTALDPTLRRLPLPRALAERGLADATGIAGRELAS